MREQRSKLGIRTQPVRLMRLPLAAAICLAVAAPVLAQDGGKPASPAATPAARKDKTANLGVVTVTAQKRTENLQKVPISINVLASDQLQALQVQSFKDYVNYLPSVTFQQGGGGIATGPGFASIYMRGVASGGNTNHSGSQPSVGVYLDDQPVTTIQGPLDIHMYDIARIEVLAGPQGTLYGASAEAGALRIITNKPDPGAFAANYQVSTDKVAHGGIGDTFDGMVNIPLSSNSAVRLVGWHEHDAGYIDNAAGSRTFPVSGITVSNAPGCVASGTSPSASNQCIGHAKKHYNDVDTNGARAALKVDLNDNWSISPTLMGQQTISHGSFASDPVVGNLAVTHFYPERVNDRWWQGALTVQGKIGNFDLTYAYAHLKRNQEEQTDYSDYSFWYDQLPYTYGNYIYDNSGALINPSEFITDRDSYSNSSHELRLVSPSDDRLRLVAGAFWQKQKHDIMQDYLINGLADSLSVPGWPNTIWLTKQMRYDYDESLFGELSWDFIPDVLTATVGERYFRTKNNLYGFYGFSKGFSPNSSYGQAGCIAPGPFEGAPCLDFNKSVRQTGSLGKFNLTWNITPTKMLYLTRSKGFRPGGVNRAGNLPPYQPDFLTNLELGWKTTWLDNRVSFNGAVFRETWNHFQFNVLGPNGLTIIENANSARVTGLESQLNWQASYNLNLSAGLAFYNAKLTAPYCGFTDASGNPATNCPAGTLNPSTGTNGPQAPVGTRLPITPRFKGNLIARYSFDLGNNDGFVQAAFVHVGERTTDLRTVESSLLGNLPAYNSLDLSAGFQKDSWTVKIYIDNAFNKLGAQYKFTECGVTVCAAHYNAATGYGSALYPAGQVYTGFSQPRTFGISFKQDF
ncbi:MAG: TonB-dependent receptor [Pseudomonadota bacterium]|jgi:outer membrane receptor protein involved in Fe transport|nr:TonB-dependent receptor [Xanthomonadaceae bacterium]MDE2247536.1 TonB-dependent receptor [Xanthomonadaceae bacterium]MDE3211412.1 TonB-dependent receptor [Pseudomonadota bacterium]